MQQHKQHFFTEFVWETLKVGSISSNFRLIFDRYLRCFPQATQALSAGEIPHPKNIIKLTPSK